MKTQIINLLGNGENEVYLETEHGILNYPIDREEAEKFLMGENNKVIWSIIESEDFGGFGYINPQFQEFLEVTK